MAKKNRPLERREPLSPESRASEVCTVAWMMSVVTTLICGFVAIVLRLAISERPGNDFALLFARLLHFGALVTAVVSLLLLAVVLKVRTVAPPLPVIWFSIGVALAVIVAAFLY